MNQTRIISSIHKFSALILGTFILAHLLNHVVAIGGISAHTHMMNRLRTVYRHPVGESILMLSICLQIATGLLKIRESGWRQSRLFDRLQVWSGAYLLLFLLAHTSAIWNARLALELETDFYFGAVVWLKSPYVYFFALYYLLGIMAFFTHIACLFRWMFMNKIERTTLNQIAWSLIGLGGLIWILILLTFTGLLYPISLPEMYHSYLP
ncbi:MAG: hypothetical protein AAF587_23270 [Bacteroidota bacterium]